MTETGTSFAHIDFTDSESDKPDFPESELDIESLGLYLNDLYVPYKEVCEQRHYSPEEQNDHYFEIMFSLFLRDLGKKSSAVFTDLKLRSLLADHLTQVLNAKVLSGIQSGKPKELLANLANHKIRKQLFSLVRQGDQFRRAE